MKHTIKIRGKIKFDPIDKTKKQTKQGSWKKAAMVIFDGDLPYWGLHMSLGYANDKNLSHSNYIYKLISNYGY